MVVKSFASYKAGKKQTLIRLHVVSLFIKSVQVHLEKYSRY